MKAVSRNGVRWSWAGFTPGRGLGMVKAPFGFAVARKIKEKQNVFLLLAISSGLVRSMEKAQAFAMAETRVRHG